MFFFLQLVNNGPSRISDTLLELHCPLRIQGRSLLYPLEFSTEGPINCTADKNMNHRKLKVSISHARAHLFGSNGAKLEIVLHPDSQCFAHIHLLLPASQPHPWHLPHRYFEVAALPLRYELEEPLHPSIILTHLQQAPTPPFRVVASKILLAKHFHAVFFVYILSLTDVEQACEGVINLSSDLMFFFSFWIGMVNFHGNAWEGYIHILLTNERKPQGHANSRPDIKWRTPLLKSVNVLC